MSLRAIGSPSTAWPPPASLRPGLLAIYVTLILFAIFYLMPVYVLLVTGLKSFTEVSLDRMWNLPASIGFDSFRDAWFGNETTSINGLANNFYNSLLLAIPATLIASALGSINGYVL